jgi:hypothetical protein
MSRIRAEDRVLFTVKEFELIQSSFPSVLKAVPRARVKALSLRARKHWDKYRQLSRTQHRTTKASAGGFSKPDANLRSERKAQIFSETVGRFEKRLSQLEKVVRPKPARAVKPPPKGIRKPIKRKKSVGKKRTPVTPAGQASLEARASRQFQKTRTRAIQGHIRASGRRRQGKRDRR